MPPLRDPRKPDESAGGEGGGRGDPLPPRRAYQEGERDEVEPHRRMAGGERAVALAFSCRDERRGEGVAAAELGHLARPGAAPMILEDRVGDEPRPDRQGEDQECRRPAVAAEEGRAAEIPGDA